MDREFARRQIEAVPDLPLAAKANRGFMRRAVRYLMDQGVRQFVDFGSGLPTEGSVHEVAEGCRVVYVDHDPVASAHSYILLSNANELARAVPITGDLLDSDRLWDVVRDSDLLDFNQPVGLLMVAVLHFLPDDRQPNKAVEHYKDQVPSGSYLAISHASTDGMPQEHKEALAAVLRNYDATTTRAVGRDRDQVASFFQGWDLLDPPGIVWTPEWHEPGRADGPEDKSAEPAFKREPWRSQIVAGVARKP